MSWDHEAQARIVYDTVRDYVEAGSAEAEAEVLAYDDEWQSEACGVADDDLVSRIDRLEELALADQWEQTAPAPPDLAQVAQKTREAVFRAAGENPLPAARHLHKQVIAEAMLLVVWVGPTTRTTRSP